MHRTASPSPCPPSLPQRTIWPQMSTVRRLRNPGLPLPPTHPLAQGLAGTSPEPGVSHQCTAVAKVRIKDISLASAGDTDQRLLLSPLLPHDTRMLESRFTVQLFRVTEHAPLSPGRGYRRACLLDDGGCQPPPLCDLDTPGQGLRCTS